MTTEQKKWIDSSSFMTLLDRWRFAPSGDEMFVGETGEYYCKVMKEKRALESDGGVGASKTIGWSK